VAALVTAVPLALAGELSDGVYGFANADEVRSHIRRRPPRQRYL